MLFKHFWPQSLKTRVTLMTLLIAVSCFLVLGFYTKNLLRDGLLTYTGEQQRSTLRLLAAEVDHGLKDRISILEQLALRVRPLMKQDPKAVQAFLHEQSFLNGPFNGGIMVLNRRGESQAEVKFLSYALSQPGLMPQELNRVLSEGRTVIGRMQVSDNRSTAWFVVVVPMRGPAGEVIGALAGEVRLDQPNFLSQLVSHRYGKTGNFFLVDTSQRLIFATSDQTRLFEILPAPGVNPWIDRFVQGFEGTTRFVNPKGVEVLISTQQMSLAHWYAAVSLNPEETFALVDLVKVRGRLAGVLMLMICLALIWLMLRRQLAPMTTAVNMLEGFVRKNQAPQALPVVRNDEVGQLVVGFNRLLATLAQQQKILRQRELFSQAVLNSVAAEIAVLDHAGVIVEINEAWRINETGNVRGSRQNGLEMNVGASFLIVCQAMEADAITRDAMTAQDGVRAVLDGRIPRFYLEYASHSPLQKRWLSMSVTPLDGEDRLRAVVSLEDITERTQMAQQVRELAFHDPLTGLPNRRLALERLSQQVVRARRAKSLLALLFIDLDKFKPINDELGHEVGDWLLQAVAQRIQESVRESDTAARLGGDEFVVLLPDLQNREAAMVVAEKIRQAMAREFVTAQGMALSISSSIGVALFPDHGLDEKDLLRLGDKAMYEAKKSGRNAVILGLPAVAESTADTKPGATASYVHLRWKDAFKSGNTALDEEHKTLFDLANTLLDEVVLRHQDAGAFEKAYEALYKHTEAHFAREEVVLRELGFADLTSHSAQHQTLLLQARTLHQQLHEASDEAGAEGKLIKFLVAELVAGHILKDDREFFALLAKPS